MSIEKHAPSTIDIYKEQFDIEIVDVDGNVLGKYKYVRDVNAVTKAVYAAMVQSTIMDFMAAREKDWKINSYEKDWFPYEPVKVKVRLV